MEMFFLYMSNVANGVKSLSVILGSALALGSVIGLIIYHVTNSSGKSDSVYKLSLLKRFLIGGLVLMYIGFSIPTSDWFLDMATNKTPSVPQTSATSAVLP